MGDEKAQGRTDGRGQMLAVLLVLVAAVIATRAIWFGNPVADIDEQLYSLIGAGLLDGELAWRQHDGGHEDRSNMKYFIEWANRMMAAKK